MTQREEAKISGHLTSDYFVAFCERAGLPLRCLSRRFSRRRLGAFAFPFLGQADRTGLEIEQFRRLQPAGFGQLFKGGKTDVPLPPASTEGSTGRGHG